MIVWEYQYVSAGTNGLKPFIEALNELGLDGWELAGFASADRTLGLNTITAILKRPRHALEPLPEGTEDGRYPDPSGRHPDRHWANGRWSIYVRDKPGGTRTEDSPYGPVADLTRVG